eukprot:727249-Hanusia_phi.AAC.13
MHRSSEPPNNPSKKSEIPSKIRRLLSESLRLPCSQNLEPWEGRQGRAFVPSLEGKELSLRTKPTSATSAIRSSSVVMLVEVTLYIPCSDRTMMAMNLSLSDQLEDRKDSSLGHKTRRRQSEKYHRRRCWLSRPAGNQLTLRYQRWSCSPTVPPRHLPPVPLHHNFTDHVTSQVTSDGDHVTRPSLGGQAMSPHYRASVCLYRNSVVGHNDRKRGQPPGGRFFFGPNFVQYLLLIKFTRHVPTLQYFLRGVPPDISAPYCKTFNDQANLRCLGRIFQWPADDPGHPGNGVNPGAVSDLQFAYFMKRLSYLTAKGEIDLLPVHKRAWLTLLI